MLYFRHHLSRCVHAAFLVLFFSATPVLSSNHFSNEVPASYVGASACATCHSVQYRAWQTSDHYRSMQVANEASVLGRFDDSSVTFHDLKTRFFLREGKYWVDTVNQFGHSQTYEILFTLGYSPLQQYLVETEKGKLQALNIAWDNRAKALGGQRWFHLQPDEKMTPRNPFFWTGFYQNWNTRCADCHSTNVKKNYSPTEHSFTTQWSDVNVACEACHGPASNHIDSINTGSSPENHGFSFSLANPVQWYFNGKDAIAVAKGEASNTDVDRCGGCHSRRQSLPTRSAEDAVDTAYHNRYSIALLHPGLYFDDGQINDEVFVLGSFLQSKMHQKGVTCSNCHEPHSSQLKFAGNGVCAQCHRNTVYDSTTHHKHLADSSGAQCVNCHMPERTYMQVDPRRDHSIKIPEPKLAQKIASSDACLICHTNKDSHWSVSSFEKMFASKKHTTNELANIRHQLELQDPSALQPARALLADSSLAPISRATLLAAMAKVPSYETVNAAIKALSDDSPLMRRAALISLSILPLEQRWALAHNTLNDPIRSVRFAAVELLSATRATLTAPQRAQLDTGLSAYRAILEADQDIPANLISLSSLALDRQDTEQAALLLRQALDIEPGNATARLNLAEIERSRNNIKAEEDLLLKGIDLAPTDANTQYAYGLFLVRQRKTGQALQHFSTASGCANATPRHAYVLALSLDSLQQTDAAIDTLIAANKRWPHQYDLLMTLVLYLDKIGQFNKSYNYISQLSSIAPDSPAVRAYQLRREQK